jgi:hypothetical protein
MQSFIMLKRVVHILTTRPKELILFSFFVLPTHASDPHNHVAVTIIEFNLCLFPCVTVTIFQYLMNTQEINTVTSMMLKSSCIAFIKTIHRTPKLYFTQNENSLKFTSLI